MTLDQAVTRMSRVRTSEHVTIDTIYGFEFIEKYSLDQLVEVTRLRRLGVLRARKWGFAKHY